jgi:LPXTG-motif cell wall-anchored protein
MKKKISKNLTSLIISTFIVFLGVGLYYFSSAKASGASFAGGNFVNAKNISSGDPSYIDPVSAKDGDTVRIRLSVVNLGDTTAANTIVSYDLSNAQSPKGFIKADGVSAINDYVNINPSGSSLNFVSGTGKKYGPACPSGCAIADDIVGSGVNLGSVEPGDTNSYQLSIEAKVVGVPTVETPAKYRDGNIFDGGVTGVTWADPVSANPGQVVEFRITVINDGTVVAKNTVVRAAFPGSPANPIVPTAYVIGEGVAQVTDNFTINVSGGSSQKLNYWEGHAIKFGPGCTNGCALPDNIYVEGINIGDVAPGVQNSYQVVFKAYLTQQSTPTPTPTPTPSPTPTPTRSPSPTPTHSPTCTPTPTRSPSPTPTRSPSPTPTRSPSPTPIPDTKLKICKYYDENGNGQIDNGESTMGWNFIYSYQGNDYQVGSRWWDILNQGCRTVDVPAGQWITVREEDRSDYRLTNILSDGNSVGGSSFSYVSYLGVTKYVTFLNDKIDSSPTPTPTITPVPSGTPNSCNGTCGSNYNCQGGLFCYQGYCRNPSCQSESSCGCPGATATPTAPPVILGATAPPVLPKTGSNDLAIVVGLLSVMGSGFWIFRKFRLV